MNRKLSVLIGGFMLVLIAVCVYLNSSVPAFVFSTQIVSQEATAEANRPTDQFNLPDANAEGFHTGLEHLPASFRDSLPDGALHTDENGNLVVKHSTRRLFDYFLAGYGEESSAMTEARIRAYLSFHLAEPARSQANLLLNEYLALQTEITERSNSSDRAEMTVNSLALELDRISALKRHHLSAEVADVFYSEEEVRDKYWIDKIRIQQNLELSQAEKLQKISEMEGQLPASMQLSMEQSQLPTVLQEQVQILRETNASPAELQQLRESKVGLAAAERLAELDARRAQWQARVEGWFKLRTEILQNKNLAQIERGALLTQMRQEQFNESEQTRINALERIRDSGMAKQR